VPNGPDDSLRIDGPQIPLTPFTLSVDGNLYLDYSVFSTSDELIIGGNVEFYGQEITIFDFYDTPVFPENHSILLTNGVLTLTLSGYPLENDQVVFGITPITDGVFEATGNIYIGDYSSLNTQVPIPATIWLFASGLLLLGRSVSKKHVA
jgi:hypothetical protein